MNSLQILILSILGVLAIVAYVITCTSKKEGLRTLAAYLLIVLVVHWMMTVVGLTIQNNKLKEIVGKKMP